MKTFNEANVVVVTPNTFPMLPMAFVKGLFALEQRPGWGWVTPSVLPIGKARDAAVEACLKKGGVDAIFFLDYDVVPPPEALRVLVDVAERFSVPVVVGGVYHEKAPPYLPLVYQLNEEKGTLIPLDLPTCLPPSQVGAVSMGCSLWPMEVFEKVKGPWFTYERNGKEYGTEDVAIFFRLKEAGVPVICVPKVVGTHWGMRGVGRGDWEAARPGYLAGLGHGVQEATRGEVL